MYEQSLALNNKLELLCHKTQPTSTLTNQPASHPASQLNLTKTYQKEKLA